MTARRSVPFAAAAVMLALAGAALADHPRYRVTVLPKLSDGASWGPAAINEAGDIVGSRATSGYPEYGYATVRWMRGGLPEQLPNPGSNAWNVPVDILEDGTVLGNAAPATVDSWKAVGWFYRDGAYDFIPEFVSGRGTQLAAVNSAGTAVANGNDGSFTGVEAFRVVNDSLSMILAEEPGYHEAADINEAGQIVGTGAIGLFRLNPDGTRTIVPPIGDHLPYRSVTGMNDLGQIIGTADRPQMQGWLAFTWTDEGGYTIIVAPGLRDTPVAIDNRGTIIGNTADNTGRGNFAWIWNAEDGFAALDELIVPEDAHYVVGSVSDMNERGEIVGSGFDTATSTDVALLLTPVCDADVNLDGDLTVADFAAFRALYLAGDMRADRNGDGWLGVEDFSTFRAEFLAGCA